MLLDVEHLKNKYGISISGVAHIGAHFGQEISEYKKHFEMLKYIYLSCKKKYSLN